MLKFTGIKDNSYESGIDSISYPRVFSNSLKIKIIFIISLYFLGNLFLRPMKSLMNSDA